MYSVDTMNVTADALLNSPSIGTKCINNYTPTNFDEDIPLSCDNLQGETQWSHTYTDFAFIIISSDALTCKKGRSVKSKKGHGQYGHSPGSL